MKIAARRAFLRAHNLAARFGVHVMPVHFYSPLPDLGDLERTRERWARKPSLPGIDVDLDRQLAVLSEVCTPFIEEYAGNEAYLEGMRSAFGPGFGYIEAQALHGVIRSYQPRRIVEVGSGVSTYCSLQALRMNKQPFSMTCIEPNPSAWLRRESDIELIPQIVQTAPMQIFEDLKDGDLLFIDSSHAVKTGSDVNHLILEVLPRLKPGVIVHFHDIYLPYDYSVDELHNFITRSETSLLRAYMIGNSHIETLFCMSHLHHDRLPEMRTIFPEYNPELTVDGLFEPGRPSFTDIGRHFPTSIYLRIVRSLT